MERSAFFSVHIALVAGKVLHILLIIIVLAHCDLLLAGPVHVTFTTCPLPASESKSASASASVSISPSH